MAKGILARLLSRPNGLTSGLSREDLETIGRYLARLDEQEIGLARAARSYVLNGTGDSVLLRIASPPNRRSSVVLYPWKDEEKDLARRFLLALEGWDPPVIKHLGDVIAASLKNGGFESFLPVSDEVPV